MFISGHVFSQGPSSPGATCCHISPGGHSAGRSSTCCLCQLWIRPRWPALLGTPQVLYLSPSYAASWLQQPSPSDLFIKHWAQTDLILQPVLSTLPCMSSTLSHRKGVSCLPETQRQSPAFTCAGGWPTFIQQLGSVLWNFPSLFLNPHIPAW